MQTWRNRECRIHAYYTRIEVEFGHAFEAARRTLFDADAASLAVVDQNLVEAVRPLGPRNARFGADEVAVVAGVTGAATEAAPGFFHRLLFRERLNDFVLRLFARDRVQHVLVDAREVREVGHVHAVQIHDDVDRNRPRLQLLAAQRFVQIEGYALAVSDG